ncbi:MAG: ABC transporter permease [Hyphomicrobiaceae bacterium]|nr:ABC transporter permease [Hyphomicrobiaceae bacterium]
MNAFENLRIAIRAVRANVLRSGLTILGIVIGVAAVIAMTAIGSGAQKNVSDRIRSLGTNVLLVQPGSKTDSGVRLGVGAGHTLTEDDAESIAKNIAEVVVAAPTLTGRAQVLYGGQNWATLIGGVTPDYLIARDWEVERGRVFTQDEVTMAAKTVVLGVSVVRKLFADSDPIGTTVRISNVPFTVIGVLAKKGQAAASGRDQDDVAFVPISSAKLRVLGGRISISRRAVDLIMVKAASEQALPEVKRKIGLLLRQRHRRAVDAEDDFQITEPSAMMEAQAAAGRTLTLLLGSIASVSLVVGGIGIMNIMLVSVTERTREIGLRQALGARRRDIRNQFLIEAMLLCLLGGLAGVLVGAGAAISIAEVAGWPVYVSPGAITLGFTFSAAIGLFFGLYPASKASRLNLIDALRYE